MNATIQFTCPQCSHQMKLPSSTVGKQGKCPSCSTVITITASQPGANANEIQVAPKQPVAEPASPQAVQRIQQPALAAVAHSTPQPALKPRKSRWKIICVTHLLTAVLTIGLMPYWKPHLEPFFPSAYLSQKSSETTTPESEPESESTDMLEGMPEDPGEEEPGSLEMPGDIGPGMVEGAGDDPVGEGDFADLPDEEPEPEEDNIKEPLPITPGTIDVKRMYIKKQANGNAVVGFRLTNASDLLLTHVSINIECFDSDGRALGADNANVLNVRSNNNAVLEFSLEDTTVEEIADWKLVIRDVRIDHGDGKEVLATSRYKINVVGIREKDGTDEIRLERRLYGHWKSKYGDFVFPHDASLAAVTPTDDFIKLFRIEVMARWYYSPEREDDKRGVDVRLHHAETGIGMQWRLVFVAKDKIVGAITSVGKDGVWQEFDTPLVQNWTLQGDLDQDQLKRRLAGHWSAKSGEFFFSATGDKCSVATPNGVTQVFRTELMSRRKLKSGFDVLLVRFHHDESREGMEWSFLFGEKNDEGTYRGFVGSLTGLADGEKWNVINEEGREKSLQLFTFVDNKTEPD